ncbi:hypothetical protein NPX13_g6082 [Xylaria arbuscula]|uniref:RBR-type E3 ubiquitin transferase n=1 Tax=Xylaria arbuscula TaxID=114810 RepID=A0A9W8ND68_9PEZI|nr:hypothetical protein NPX13_g6082 [Xylaria arbuscula]
MDEDPRDVELSTITAIYPELQLDENDPHKVSIELPVSLPKPVTVLFPAATEAAPPLPSSEQVHLATAVIAEGDSHALSYLPALQVEITLPDGYPDLNPPRVSISTSPPWLSDDTLRKLETDITGLWEEIGRDQVIFTYIDHIQRSSEDVFGLVDSKGTLKVILDHKIALLDYDINAKRKAFEKETFECGICLDPKKGSVCHRMIDCGHVFCTECLKDFYNNAITEGDVSAVTCPAPNCARDREKNAANELSSRSPKVKTSISPSELLQIPLSEEMVKRYVMLKHKNKLESDKNTVYCPRSWCQGAARSKRHKKPEGLELVESDDENEEDTGLLAICEDCGFAFCTRCAQGWHGEFSYCIPKERKEALAAEEKLTLEYLLLHSTACPTCGAPCQKSHGCNHMQCFRCRTHFCYLCSAWLDPSNPYKHFNTPPTEDHSSCYMRLWELEGGDGDNVGIAWEGGDAMRNADIPAGQYGEHLEIVQPRHEQRPREPRNEAPLVVDPPAPQPAQQPVQPPQRHLAVAREGPLILRINGGNPAVPGEANRRAQPPIANPRGNVGQRGGHIRGGGNNRIRGPRAAHRVRDNGAELPPHHEGWVRNFVQLALNDEEHLIDDDSDNE